MSQNFNMELSMVTLNSREESRTQLVEKEKTKKNPHKINKINKSIWLLSRTLLKLRALLWCQWHYITKMCSWSLFKYADCNYSVLHSTSIRLLWDLPCLSKDAHCTDTACLTCCIRLLHSAILTSQKAALLPPRVRLWLLLFHLG